jgi:hypothetical protein
MFRCLTPLCLAVALAVLSCSPANAAMKLVGSKVRVSGRIADMTQVTTASGYQFRVGLTGLSYRGRVDRALLDQKDSEKLTIWLALRDIVITINSTSISGRPGRANCGPIKIQLGHRRDLWIAYDFKKSTEAMQPALKLMKTRFALPADNWSVGSPSWVRVSGFGMSRSKVVTGLRSGLIENKKQIEKRMIDVSPTMLSKVAPVPNNTSVNRRSIAPAVHKKLKSSGLLSMKPEPPIDLAGILS